MLKLFHALRDMKNSTKVSMLNNIVKQMSNTRPYTYRFVSLNITFRRGVMILSLMITCVSSLFISSATRSINLCVTDLNSLFLDSPIYRDDDNFRTGTFLAEKKHAKIQRPMYKWQWATTTQRSTS